MTTLPWGATRRILQEYYDEAARLLREHRHQLDVLAAALLERETLVEEILVATGLRRASQPESASPVSAAPTVNGVSG